MERLIANHSPSMMRALRLILAQGGLEDVRQVHRGRQTSDSIHSSVARRLVDLGLARWEESPARPTPRPPNRCHAQLDRWRRRQRRGTVPTLHATAAGCRVATGWKAEAAG